MNSVEPKNCGFAFCSAHKNHRGVAKRAFFCNGVGFRRPINQAIVFLGVSHNRLRVPAGGVTADAQSVRLTQKSIARSLGAAVMQNSSAEEYKLVSRFQALRKTLLADRFADRWDKPLV